LKRSVTFWLAGETKSQSKLILADFVVDCVPLSDPAGIMKHDRQLIKVAIETMCSLRSHFYFRPASLK